MNYRLLAVTFGLVAGLAVLPVLAQKRTAEKKTAAKVQAQTGAKAEPRQRVSERRDPFVAVIRPPKPEAAGPAMLTCGPGVRSIIVGQTELNGVVKAPTGMIAVVTSSPGRTYFLKEGTPLCNGRVAKIGGDAVVFEENVIDAMGVPGKREVIRKIPTEAK